MTCTQANRPASGTSIEAAGEVRAAAMTWRTKEAKMPSTATASRILTHCHGLVQGP